MWSLFLRVFGAVFAYLKLLTVLGLVFLPAPALALNSLLELGSLSSAYSKGLDISSNGLVVVGETSVAGAPVAQAFGWSMGTGMIPLFSTPSQNLPYVGYSSARGVNADGTVIVGAVEVVQNIFRAFAWNPGLGMGVLTPAVIGTPSLGDVAEDVDAAGRFVVGYSEYARLTNPNGYSAVLWDLNNLASTPTVLGDLDGGVNSGFDFSRANAISDDGAVVVGNSTNAGGIQEAFYWDRTALTPTMIGLGDLGFTAPNQFASAAHGVSANGNFIVGQAADSPTDRTGFIYDVANTMMYELNEFTGHDTANALAISDDGSRVVGYSALSGTGTQAVLWDVDVNNLGAPNSSVLLSSVLAANGVNMTGITLIEATGISSDGAVITGSGNFGNGTEAFITSENGLTTVSSLVHSLRPPGYLTSQASGLMNEFNNDLMTVARHYKCAPMGVGYSSANYCLYGRSGAEIGLSGITGDRYTGNFGVIFPQSEQLKWGFAGGVGYSTLDDISQVGAVDMAIGEVGFFMDYHAHEVTGFRASSVLSAGFAIADIKRDIRNGREFETYEGNSSGFQAVAKTRFGYGFAAMEQHLRLEPYLGIAAGISQFSGYTEDNTGVLRANIGNQDLKYYGVTAGLTLDYSFSDRLAFFGDYSVTYDEGKYSGFDFEIESLNVDTATGSIDDSGTRGRLQLGVNYQLTETLGLNADAEYHHHIHGDNADFSVGGIKLGMTASF